MVADTKQSTEPNISNMSDKTKNAKTKVVDDDKQGAAVTKVHSPRRLTQKRNEREDISLGSVPQPALKVAKEGEGMVVDLPGEVSNITGDNKEELALLNSAMKDAESMDEDMELELPTLA